MGETGALRTHRALQEQFDHLHQQTEAASLGMWVFLATEALFFGGLFLTYFVYRGWYPEAFAAGSAHMHTLLGVLNTVVLLVSSFTVALAVRAGRLGAPKTQQWALVATLVLGLAFVGVKLYEYQDHIAHGLFPNRSFHWTGAADVGDAVQIFFTLYFVMTGLHLVHMLIGIGVMGTLFMRARRGAYDESYHTPLEVGGLYWHFVDLVWIYLFPLLYLDAVYTRVPQ